MRIAHIMAGAPHGGAELFFERLCIAQHADGELILPIIRSDPDRADRLARAGLAPVALRFGGALDGVTRWRIGRVLRAYAPKIAVAWMGRAAAAVPRGGWTLIGRLGGYYDLRRFRRCHHLVANTPALAAWICAQGVAPSRVHTLPNFAPDHAGVAAADRSAFGIPADVPLLLGLGRLHPVKGFDILLRALALLPDAYCLIAGDGPERARLVQLADTLGVTARLRLPGWRQNPGALLAMADLFVCPSRQEPLGNAILDAWSAARPIIASASEGPASLIADGQTGRLVPIGDAPALAAAIADMLAGKAHAAAMAAAGRARFEADFAASPVLAAWRAFLHGMV